MERSGRRIEELKKLEGCVFCRLNARTDRAKLAIRNHGLKYKQTELGDYLICEWHEALLERDWMDDADMRRATLNAYLIEHRAPKY